MLVINSNSNNVGDFFLTNQNLGIAPDLVNDSVILPSSLTLRKGVGIQAQSHVMSVSGTYINTRSGNIVYPKYWDSNDGGSVGISYVIEGAGGSASDFTRNYYHRFGIPYQLAGGEIVGKQIKGGLKSLSIPGFGLSVNSSVVFKYVVKLLHSDGTLSVVGEISWSIPQASYSSAYTLTFDDTNGMIQGYSGSGVVAQAGDFIVADIEITTFNGLNVGSNQYTQTAQLGTVYTTTASNRLFPLCISIE